MTPWEGMQAAYVRGAKGRRLRPLLLSGNIVQASLRARSESQLPQAEIELLQSRAPLMSEPLPAAAIEWATALAATALPEGQPYPRLHAALDGLLAAVEAAPSAIGWGGALVRYELLLLSELGGAICRPIAEAAGIPSRWRSGQLDRSLRRASA
jgi:DNA repair protein RecO (recombination protein O)